MPGAASTKHPESGHNAFVYVIDGELDLDSNSDSAQDNARDQLAGARRRRLVTAAATAARPC